MAWSTRTMNVFTVVMVYTILVAAAGASKNRNGKQNDGESIYEGAMNWAASVGPFSGGDGKGLSSDLICDATGNNCRERMSKAMGDVLEEAGVIKGKVSETAHGAVDLTKEAVGKVQEMASEKARYEKDVIAKTAQQARQAVSAGHKVAKEQGKEVIKKAKEAKDMATTVVHHVSGNVSRAMHQGDENEHQMMKHPTCSIAGMASLVNLLASASAFGEGLWVTFIWGYALNTNLPSQQLQMLEIKMYGLYFKTMSSTIAIAFLTHSLSPRNTHILQTSNLLASLLMALFNLIYINPLTAKMVHERLKLEKEGGRRDIDHPAGASSARPRSRGCKVRDCGKTEPEGQKAKVILIFVEHNEFIGPYLAPSLPQPAPSVLG